MQHGQWRLVREQHQHKLDLRLQRHPLQLRRRDRLIELVREFAGQPSLERLVCKKSKSLSEDPVAPRRNVFR